jgi:CheY-like chemotaxis protein
MMKPYGMTIDCVTSGRAAIELIRDSDTRYNAIFMDHMMPEMDGSEATRIIREEIGTEYARNIPIIALTANAIVGNEEMFLQSGFQAFLSKPIDIIRMDSVINHWVRDRELEKKLTADNPQNIIDLRSGSERRSDSDRRSGFDRRDYTSTGKLKISGLDVEQGLKRFGDDEETYLGVIESFVRNTRPLLEQIESVSEEKLPDYAIVVHGIKSSSRSIGADPLGAQAEALEKAAKAGDLELVGLKNGEFIKAARELTDNLEVMLRDISANEPERVKAEPDAAVLAALRAACESFDIDEVDKAVAELTSYSYETGGELVDWIRAQVEVMGLKKIAERLA